MTAAAKAHAKYRAPSSAKRWLSCPYTAQLIAMYPNEPTEASLKGDYWHELMEDTIRFGVVPSHASPDEAEAMDDLLIYVNKRIKEMTGPVQVYVEVQLQIPETGELGTVDILLVGQNEIEIIDEKSGYIVVDVKMNAQMLAYLCGAIALYGHKRKYTLTVHQPNYDHIEGTIRSFQPTTDDIEWFRQEIAYSIANDNEVKAGKHCKDTYCPHRGSCSAFLEYVQKDLALGWHPSELVSMDDETLSKALDMSDELGGWRNSLRSEAMKRIMNMDRSIPGYKVVKGRKQRQMKDAVGLVNSVAEHMGPDWAFKLFPDLEPLMISLDFPMVTTSVALKFLGTPKHVEDICKLYARAHSLPRGGWKQIYDNVAKPYIYETNTGLSLERAIDGRPAHKRGSEFSPIDTGLPNII